MPTFVNMGGGGVSFGYRLNQYLTENDIPAAGNENDIAAVTGTPIPSIYSGGIIWSVSEPTTRSDGKPLQAGDLWILESDKSSFRFSIVNGVYVYGVAALQYNGLSWVLLAIVKIYKGGIWIPFRLFLHYQSNQCIGATGGWEAVAWKFASNATAYAPVVTYNSDHVEIVMPDVANRSGAYHIKNDIDLTPYTSIKIDSYGYANTDNLWLIVIPRTATYLYDGAVSRLNLIGARAVRSMDVTAFNGYYDVCVAIKHYAYNSVCKVYSIELVK